MQRPAMLPGASDDTAKTAVASSKTPSVAKSDEPRKILATGTRNISNASPTAATSLELAAVTTSVARIVSLAGGATSRGRMI